MSRIVTSAVRLTVPALLVAGAVAVPTAAAHAAPTTSAARSCDLINRTITATATPNPTLTERFADYGDSGVGWTGGDSTYSLTLPDGQQAWFFSDTFLGPVDADGSRPTTAPFINNSIVLDDGDDLTTVTGGTADAPEAIVPPTPEQQWHWIGDPQLTRRGDLQIPLLRFEKFGPGSFDFGWTANLLATLDAQTLEVISVTDLPSATGINWGSWTTVDGPKTYIYGIKDIDGVRSAFVARVSGNQGLAGLWKYWDGSRWSIREEDAAPVASYVANEFSVAPFEDGYLMVTHDTSELFGNRVVAQVSCSLEGPFEFATELYRAPESGLFGSYGDPDVFTYNSHEHPELRNGNTLLVTHNVNTFDNVGDVYDDVTIYRPRFYDVTLTLQ